MRKFTRWTAAGVLAVGVVTVVASGWGRSQPPTPSAVLAPATPSQTPALVARPVVVPAADVPRQEAAVGLVWQSPVEARVRKAARYTLTATNTCNQIVQKVTVQVRVPNGVLASGCSPAPRAVDGVLLWDLGDLRPNEARHLVMDFTPSTRGALAAEAWVTFTGTAAATVPVKEERIEVTCQGSKSVELGGLGAYRYTIKNAGDVPITGIRYEHRFLSPPPGEHPPGVGSVLLGRTLEPGEEVVVGAYMHRVPALGEFHLGFEVTADGGLRAATSRRVPVVTPRLDVRVTGPAEVGLRGTATYTVTVTNTGSLTAEGVALRCEPGPGIEMPAAAPGVTRDAAQAPAAGTPRLVDEATRNVGALKPGESKEFTFTGTATRPGGVFVKAVAAENVDGICRGVRHEASGGGECKTVVRGAPGIRMEVADTADPVLVNGETVYEIKVTNTGTEADRNLRLRCDLPAEAELLEATGPTTYLQQIGVDFNGPGPVRNQRAVTFAPVRELGPQTEVVFRVRVKLTVAGDVRFRAAITSDHLTTPVVREESSNVYGN